MNKDRVTSRVNVTGTPGLRRLLQDEDIRASFDAQMLTRTVALEVKRIRKEIGITQSELAKRANTTQPEIAKIEKGESPRGPTLLTIERVSKALDRKFALKVVTIRKGSNKHVRRFKRRKRRDFQYLG